MGVSHSGLSWIVVSDLDKAVAFFTKTLDLEINSRSDEYGWVELKAKNGGAMLGLARDDKESPIHPGQNAVMTLTVDNLDAEIANIESAGVTLIGEPQEVPGHVRLQLFKDNDGNLLQLVELLG